MLWSVLADLTLLAHAAFVMFVVAGGFLVLRWPRLAWAHLPCAAWGAWVEFSGWVCPLTPLEQRFRQEAGEVGYEGGFIEHYVTSVLYPEGLTREVQVVLGVGVVAVNAALYTALLWRRRGSRAPAGGRWGASDGD